MDGEHRQWPVHRPVTRSLTRDDSDVLAQDGEIGEELRPQEVDSGATSPDGSLEVQTSHAVNVSTLEHSLSVISLAGVQSVPTMAQSSMSFGSVVSSSSTAGRPITREPERYTPPSARPVLSEPWRQRIQLVPLGSAPH